MNLVQALENAHDEYILWVRTDSIGDALLSHPMLDEIKKAYPQVKIAVLCQNHIRELYETCPYVNHIITFDKNRINYKPYVDCIISAIRELKPLFAFNSQYSRESISDTFTIQSGATYTAGFNGNTCNITKAERDANNALYTNLITLEESHKIELKRYVDFLSSLGITVNSLKPYLYTATDDEKMVTEEVFESFGLKHQEPIVILPSAQSTYRVYPWFLEVMEGLKDFPLIIAGGADMLAIGKRLSENFSGTCFNLISKTTIRQTAALIRKARLAICSESASAHIACAVGTPNVVIIGGGHFGRFFPYSNLTSTVSLPLNCYGCNWRCSQDSAYYCINDIEPKSVIYAVRESINGVSQKPKVYLQNSSLNPDVPEFAAIDRFVSDVEIVNLSDNAYENPNMLKPSNAFKHRLPRITIVTPSFNQAAFLEECIVSVISSGYPNLQYIVMDGGSTDGSLEIIHRYEKYLSHCQSAPDGGQYEAINEGFKLADGEIMGWINSDDKLHPGALWTVAKVFTVNKDVQWIMGRPTVWTENGKLASVLDPIPKWCRGFYLEGKIGPPHIQQESTFWRSELWENAGGCIDSSLKYAGDLELWARFFRHTSLYSVDAIISGFRARTGQKTCGQGIDLYNEEAELILKRERELYEKTRDALLPPPEIITLDTLVNFDNFDADDNDKVRTGGKSIRIHVSFSGLGAGNIGDEAMMLGFLSLYNLPDGTTVEVWDKNEPALKVFQERFEFVDYTDTETCQALCLSADCVFVIGATIVTEMLCSDWPLRVLGDKYDFCFTHGITVYAIGTGVDMIYSDTAKGLFYKGFSGITSWTVRSERSRRVLIGLGINSDKIITAADLAWHTPMNEFDPVWANDYLSSLGIDMSKPIIGVNVVNEKWIDELFIKEQLAESLDELIEKHGYQTAFFCNETREGKYFDKEAALSVIALMKNPATFVPNTYYTPIQMISMLSLCRFTISWRYHFTIFSILADTVPISVLRGDKLIELVNEFNGLHAGRPESISKVKFINALLKGQTHYDKIKLAQKEVVKNLKQRSFLNTAFISNLNSYSFAKIRVLNKNRFKQIPPGLLWVRIDSIGDALLSIGMLSEIRKKYEGYRITVLCQSHVRELYETCPYVDNIIDINKHKAGYDELYRNIVIKSLRDLNLEVALNSQYSREPLSDFFTIESAAKEKVAFFGDNGNHLSVSIREKNNLAHSKIIEIYEKKLNELRRNEQFLTALSINTPPLTPQLWLTEHDESFCEEMFNLYNLLTEKTIVVAPGAQFKYKVYERLHEALDGLEDYDICVLGGSDALPMAEKIEERCKGRVFNLINKTTLRQTAAVIKNSALLVGVDSMAAHMACTFNVPNVVVLGGGHPGRFLPYHHTTHAVTLPLNCYGCNWDSRYGINYGSDLNCRYGTIHCISGITPETINSTIKKVLAEITPKAQKLLPSWGVATGLQLDEVTAHNNKPEIIFESPSVWGFDKKVPLWKLPEDHFHLNQFKITYSHEKPQDIKLIKFNKSPYEYLVTVIVSAYKSERFIRQCLTDLCSQTIYNDLEIIVLDANSPENERKVVEEFQKIHSNITYIRTGSRIGVYSAWNIMVKLARGKYITPMSTNDRLRCDAYELLSGYLEQFPDVALVYGNTYRTKNPTDSFESHSLHSEFSWPEYSYEQLLQFSMVGPHPMWRASVHDGTGFFDETFVANGDQEFFLRLGSRYELMSVPEYTGLYWLAPDALSVEGKTPQTESERAHKKYQEMYINEMTAKLKNIERPVYIWGAGEAGKMTTSILSRYNIMPTGFVDNDKNKWGYLSEGLTVYCPDDKVINLTDISQRPFIIIASLYFREIIIELKRAGYINRKDYFTNIYTMKWI
ncbi:glycosyltransferase [Candidatus Magnetomonas plexicatena]|uniref:glycosyltransferase n=1 Tax=Candidatus Magnetomonas plexicatena TaxID=2552947 RepID=UPI001C7719E7|nr:glycosyltransferase [Nitrospirales bacterium LBB_01]